jgi:hypothetical protein
MAMRMLLLVGAVLALLDANAFAQSPKPTRFWNLTRYTVTSFQLSPVGQQAWGANLCKLDSDGTVDHDERLRIPGVKAGRYDVKIADKSGRVCVVRDIEVKEGAVFSIEEKQMTDCGKS